MKLRKIVKLGGSVWETLHSDYFEEWRTWLSLGHELILLHGGGPRLSAYCEALQIQPVFEDGRRVTTKEVLLGAERVLAGEMQTQIVAKLGQNDIQAVGLSGVDGQMLTGRQIVSLGAVGEVEHVNSDLIEVLLSNRYVPVVTSLLYGKDGTLNCNGDDCAIAVATALQADSFEMLTDVPGIQIDGVMQHQLTKTDIEKAIESGQIYGGMVPKSRALLSAVEAGIHIAMIRDGRRPDAKGTKIKEAYDEFTTTYVRETSH